MNSNRTGIYRRAAVATFLLVLSVIPFAPGRVLAAIVLAGFLPASALATRAPFGLVGRLALSLALSPVLFGAVVLGAIALGVSASAAAWVSAALWAVVFTLGSATPPPAGGEERRIAAALAVVFAVAAALALSLPLSDLWWRVREDSWFHAAVFHRLTLHGLPLVDPYFSPLRLQYMYFYHAILSGVSTLARLDPFHAMIAVNALALAGCLAAFAFLAGFFSRRVWPCVLGAALLVFGMNGLFFVFYPIRLARSLVGETAGADVLRAFFPWSPQGHDTAAALLAVEGNQFLFLDKFMLGTALTLTLGLVCAQLALFLAARLGRWHRALDVAWVVTFAALVHLHLVIGVAAWAAAVGAIALLLIIRSRPDEGGPSYARLLWLTFAALVLSLPYLYSVLPRGGGPESIRLAVQPRYLLGLFSDLLPALVLAVPFLLLRRPSATGIVRFWFLGVLAMACVVDLPTNNETKFSYLLFIPAAAFAVGGLDRLWQTSRGRRFALVFVVASTVPLNTVYFFHAFRDSTTFPVSDDERGVYAWIARETPRDAIFIEEDDIVRVPVLAGRDQYWGTETYAANWGYAADEIARRREVRDAVFSDRGIGDEESAALRSLGRPVYVVCRKKQGDQSDFRERFAGDGRYVERYAAPSIAVYQLGLD